MAALLIMGAAVLAACAAVPKAWMRADGRPIDSRQMQIDDTVCRGETAKADQQGGSQNNLTNLDSPFGPDRQHLQVYDGCMAEKGYLSAHQ